MSFTIYSDGSGTTGGPAGIGFITLPAPVINHDLKGLHVDVGSLPLADANNHRAELLAAIHALDSIPERQDVVLYSDSRYVVFYGLGWRRVANLDLWPGFITAIQRHRSVHLEWIPGHSGIDGNQRAHRLASEARKQALLTFGSPSS